MTNMARTAMHVLVVDDDPMLQKLLQRGLTAQGSVVDVAGTAADGLYMAQDGTFDLVILDVELPDGSGLEVSKYLRAGGNTVPILMLTARSELSDRLTGFEAGVDDYLTKPFAFKELLLRMQAITRRGTVAVRNETLTLGDLVLDRLAHEVTRAGTPVRLPPREFTVLEFLMEHPNQALSRTVIMERVWDYSFEGSSNVVDASIRRIRKAIGDDRPPRLIQTIHGIGYRIKAPPS
jgi:two-component system, OmpR family, response regulator